MVQLWVNLPAKDKSTAPGYQTLLSRDIPTVELPDRAGTLRVIAGEYDGHRGPAHTFTPIDLWDVRLRQGGQASLTLPEGHTVAIVVLKGAVQVNGDVIGHNAQLVLLDRKGGEITLEADGDVSLLILSGKPIDEPVVMHGPFVMNTPDEITQAITDLQSGRFGEIAPTDRSQPSTPTMR
jgi:redox-sensitive bicupin YhaK (pirin superfamily)